MARQSKDVEILVHVAAPSRTADDVTYRRLAQAYLSFTADRRTRVASIAATDEPERSSPAAAEEPRPPFNRQDCRRRLKGSKLPERVGQSLVAMPPTCEPRFTSFVTVDVTDESRRDTGAVVLLRPAESDQRQWRRDGTADNDETIDVPSSFPAPTQDEVDSNTSVVSLGEHKVIPVTPLVPHLPPGAGNERPISVLSNPPTSSPHRAGSEPLPSKKAQTAFGGIDALSLAQLQRYGLAKLALDLSSRYHPVELRPVEPLERGYWLIDCSRWSSEKRLEAWVFLTNYLHKGLAGWGVWCRRDAAHGWIRLYCWGCVVKHTYLLLYLASARQIKTTRAKWIGSDGEMALEVPARDRRS
ncbi:hypothetical protein ACCO45_003358 [Purpureocillium lilacinum]|uniref:Uncharacterized protein n=1 Tax=Purpureocillium lilacinum TaxID=33203 RepID=A0ACC4E2I1_PURLI